MIVEVVHAESGKRYHIPSTQAIVYLDNGQPCAITYEHAGINLHTDVSKEDFDMVCSRLKVKPINVDHSNKVGS